MRVLIADDNRDAADTLAMPLAAWGFEPIVAYDGLAALALLNEIDAPTLVLLDWLMPGLNGIEICRELRKDSTRPYKYVILVTGRGAKEQMLDGLNAGADDYLLKPVESNELRARLNAGKRILELQEQLLITQRQLRAQATRDSLTGLWNRAMILEIFHRELERSRRETQPISVLMADVDHFKIINDTHGHLVGDQVLRQTAERLQAVLRPYDTVGRYGGEEFMMVLPGCGPDIAVPLAERLRRRIAAEPFRIDDATIPSTLSLGIASGIDVHCPQDLLRRADNALYRAKREGRNRIAIADADMHRFPAASG